MRHMSGFRGRGCYRSEETWVRNLPVWQETQGSSVIWVSGGVTGAIRQNSGFPDPRHPRERYRRPDGPAPIRFGRVLPARGGPKRGIRVLSKCRGPVFGHFRRSARYPYDRPVACFRRSQRYHCEIDPQPGRDGPGLIPSRSILSRYAVFPGRIARNAVCRGAGAKFGRPVRSFSRSCRYPSDGAARTLMPGQSHRMR
jgi:hypothetical protein